MLHYNGYLGCSCSRASLHTAPRLARLDLGVFSLQLYALNVSAVHLTHQLLCYFFRAAIIACSMLCSLQALANISLRDTAYFLRKFRFLMYKFIQITCISAFAPSRAQHRRPSQQLCPACLPLLPLVCCPEP